MLSLTSTALVKAAAPTQPTPSLQARVAQAVYEYRKAAGAIKTNSNVDGVKIRVSVQIAQAKPSSSDVDLSKKEGTFAIGSLAGDGGNAGGVVQMYWIPESASPLVHLASLAVGPDQYLQQTDSAAASLFSATHPALTFAEAQDATLVLEEVKFTSESVDTVSRREFAINTTKGKKSWKQRKQLLMPQPKVFYCNIVNEKVVEPCQ